MYTLTACKKQKNLFSVVSQVIETGQSESLEEQERLWGLELCKRL